MTMSLTGWLKSSPLASNAGLKPGSAPILGRCHSLTRSYRPLFVRVADCEASKLTQSTHHDEQDSADEAHRASKSEAVKGRTRHRSPFRILPDATRSFGLAPEKPWHKPRLLNRRPCSPMTMRRRAHINERYPQIAVLAPRSKAHMGVPAHMRDGRPRTDSS